MLESPEGSDEVRKHASEMIAKHSTMVNASVSNATMWPLFAVLALVALQAVVNMTAMVWYFYSRARVDGAGRQPSPSPRRMSCACTWQHLARRRCLCVRCA